MITRVRLDTSLLNINPDHSAIGVALVDEYGDEHVYAVHEAAMLDTVRALAPLFSRLLDDRQKLRAVGEALRRGREEGDDNG